MKQKKGRDEGGIPIGAVLVHNEKIIGRGHNRRVQEGGIETIVLDDKQCISMMQEFIDTKPDLWNEDIGET